MKRALVLQHMDHDHPGRFLDFFSEDNIIPTPVRLFEGQAIPSLAGYDLMFVLGGAQDTWQEDKYPWLAGEKEAIREWVGQRAKPYVGVCLGHQLLCEAMGGSVGLAKTGEVGVHQMSLTDAGLAHRFMQDLPVSNTVLQWHFAEVKKVPPGGVVLARSEATEVQSVAIGDHAIGTQFHCEFTPQTLMGWTSVPAISASLDKINGPGALTRFMTEAYPMMPRMRAMTHQIYENLVRATGLRPR